MDTISRRRCLVATAATLAALAAGRQTRAAPLATEERAVADFDTVLWDGAGELLITQTRRERLTIEAEPAVLAKVVAEVTQRRLHIGLRPGTVRTQEPIRFRLEVKALAALETRGSGQIRIGPLDTAALSLRLAGSDELRLAELRSRTLELRLEGAGEVAIAGGQVDRQHVVIAGAGNYAAWGLASREADVAIEGSGEVRVAVAERLSARISGSGDVLYRGNPQVSQTVTGAGGVRRASGERP